MWPFKKRPSALHPSLQRLQEILDDPRCTEWFEIVSSGATRGMPIDIADDVQEAIHLSYAITSGAGVSSASLLRAVKNKDLNVINRELVLASSYIDEGAYDNSRAYSKIIEWANDYDLPDLSSFDATFYKQTGVPRDIRKIAKLRFLHLGGNHDIVEMPDELAKLPLLQGICISDNKISSIPNAIYDCRLLQRLDLEGNEIRRVEDGIHKLSNLLALDLCNNRLDHVTSDILRMPALRHLDISDQRNEVDFMRAPDTPLSDMIYKLVGRIEVKY